MTTEMLQQLVRQAREDPELFHALVFDSDKVLARLSYLDEDARDALSRSTPELFVASLVGETREPGFAEASGCPPGVTCACTGETCGGLTCGYTYALAGGDYARLPEILGAGACGGNVTCSCTTGTCDGTCGGRTCDVTCSGDSCGTTCGDSCGYTTNLSAVDRLDDIDGFRLDFGVDRF